MHLDTVNKLKKDPIFGAGLILSLSFLCLIIIGPIVAPYDPYDFSFTPLLTPDLKHPFGTNDIGMDILSELMYGSRNTLLFGITTALFGLFLGVAIGLLAAWYGSWIDHISMRLADTLLSIPNVMILILIAAFFRPKPLVLSLLLASLTWPITAKVFRAQALVIKRNLYIKAAHQMGANSFYIIIRHLIPELFPLYAVGFIAKLRMGVIMESSLAFMGLFEPGRKSLGIIINHAMKYYYQQIWWNWLLPPVILLSLFTITTTLMIISIETVFDPKLREAY